MKASLLIVSSDDFPNPVVRQFEKLEFNCHYSRGVLKTREILEKQSIDAIVWLFKENESALARDLLKVFNLHMKVPVVFITENYDQLDFAEDIKGLFANLDLHDDMGDIIQTIETACSQSIIKEQEPVVIKAKEIEFKNAVAQIIGGASKTDINKKEGPANLLDRVELWEAVDRNEKQILAGGSEEDNKKEKGSKWKQFLKKH